MTQINEWEEGMKIEVVPSENDEKQKLTIADLDFSKTNVYEILSQGEIIAEVCKEYLYNEDIKNTAIVIYPLKENNTNYQKGVVWQIYDAKGKVGGIVNWNKIHNRFEQYSFGSQNSPLYF